MDTLKTTVTQRIAEAAGAFQLQLTGRRPKSVTAVLSDDTLVVTLYGALSLAEKVMAKTATGAAQVQEFHRQLFATSCESFRREIARITGSVVREAASEVEPASGAVIHAFTTGTVVQIFHLSGGLPSNEIPGNFEPIALHPDAGDSAGTTTIPERKLPC